MEEIWKEYKVYQGYGNGYCSTDIEISNYGNIRGNEHSKWNNKPFSEEMIIIKNGRRFIGNVRIYNLVWCLFGGEKPKGYDIHHKDFNKLNDSIDNLECITKSKHQAIHRKHNKEIGKEEPAAGHAYICSEETKQKLSEVLQGVNTWSKGISISEETKKKISVNNAKYWKDKSRSAETKKKLSDSFKGRVIYNNGVNASWFDNEEQAIAAGFIYKGRKITKQQ